MIPGLTAMLPILMLLVITTSLHTRSEEENTELIKLKEQQQYLGDRVSQMLEQSSQVKQRLASATDDQERVELLEQAIYNQREQVFDLKNRLIPPFNDSETACEQLTDKEKVNILDKLYKTRSDLEQLQTINNKLDQSKQQVQNVSRSIEKEFILLQQIQDILKIQCKQYLSPTIYQSDLNAKNWVLGPQTMDNLQQEYSERALIFHNITNCPIETPFYNPRLQECIQCEEPSNLFDMYSKECTSCEADQQVDTIKRKCIARPRYTNFSRVKNWNLDGGKLPAIDPELSPCPDDSPYYNGVICTRCDLPKYWSVSKNLCAQCKQGYQFDLNTNQCQEYLQNKLSLLHNTQWVAEDMTQVIQDRVDVLDRNGTNGLYTYCPSQAKPFYDGISCIFCKVFDMDQLKCVEAPEGTVYNDNMKKFVAPQNITKQTDPGARRYVHDRSLPDGRAPNCNLTHPYWDGIACIYCAAPFDIFNVQEKKCIVCDADEVYDEQQHICKDREKIYISQNYERLLATDRVTVPEYKQQLINRINDSPQSIVYPCPDKKDYSNITHCFPCQQNEYFNVETYECVICDGTYLQNNKTCKTKVYIFTNLKVGKIVDMGGNTVQGQDDRINQFLRSHPDSYVCPLDNPYAIDNTTCGPCPQLFSYSNLKCTSCKEYYTYVASQKQCRPAQMLVNFSNPDKILVNNQQTLSSFKRQQQQVKARNPELALVCPKERPYTAGRDFCFDCSQSTPYFNYTVKQCQNCPQTYTFDPATVSCVPKYFITLFNRNTQTAMLGTKDYTLPAYKQDQQNLVRNSPHENCTSAQPYGTKSGCVQCYQPTSYFNIKTKQCADAKKLIDFASIDPDYIVPPGKTLENYINDQQKFANQTRDLTIKCPEDKPYTKDRTYCFDCTEEEHFNFENNACERCPDKKAYIQKTKSCEDLFYVTKITTATEKNMKGNANYTVDNYKNDQQEIKKTMPFQQCTDQTPYATTYGCKQCYEPTPYFNVKTKQCADAKKLTDFASIDPDYIVPPGKTLENYINDQKNFVNQTEDLTIKCPEDKPYTKDRSYCFDCAEEEHFNFENNACERCPDRKAYVQKTKSCEELSYVSHITTTTEKNMKGNANYTVDDYKNDQEEIKKTKPFQQCTDQTPYATVYGCKQCYEPTPFFDVKKKDCSSAKKLINFPGVGQNYIVGQDKSLSDYKDVQDNFKEQSESLTVQCEQQTPYTSDRNYCFSCEQPTGLFNFETKRCQGCGQDSKFNSVQKKCLKTFYYTQVTPALKDKMIEDGNKSIQDYQNQQNDLKKIISSEKCPADKPFATSNDCIDCKEAGTYFNIESKSCERCENEEQYFPDNRKCLKVTYNTDLNNPNIMTTPNLDLQQAKSQQEQKANQQGYKAINCTGDKPFATKTECISCPDKQKKYFNIETRQCTGCKEFYQYFEDNQCKDNIILINTKQMISYSEVDNYTKYNTEKFNNFTYLQNDHVVDCPADQPFYDGDVCLQCPDSQPIFNLKDRNCEYIDQLRKSNPAGMKNYIEEGDSTLTALNREISILNPKVNIKFCPVDKPYLTNDQCIDCKGSTNYFNLGTKICQSCGSDDNCFSN